MLVSPLEIEALARRLGDAGKRFRFATVPTSIDALTFVRAGAPLVRSAQFFSTPEGDVWGGLGEAWTATASGDARFGHLDAALAIAPKLPAPFRCFLGFSFSADGPRSDVWKGFGSASIVLPQLSVGATADGETYLMVAVLPGAEVAATLDLLGELRDPGPPVPPDPGTHTVLSQPSPTEWRGAVGEAVAAMRAGSLDKVVLSRSVMVTAETAPDPFDLAALLSTAYPQCHAFAWQVGEATFVGASPELLLEKTADAIRLNPLAGSAPRGEGEDEDRRLSEELMRSVKDRHEHAIVVDDIATRLRPLTRTLDVPEHPALRRVATVQHLSSEISGRLAADSSPLELLGVLHPTPAVGGTPRRESAAFIDKMEGLDRGWYSGGIGWVTPDGDCRLALSIRCGLIRAETAFLYAGAGIVAESDPEAELGETRLKFRPLLELLAAT